MPWVHQPSIDGDITHEQTLVGAVVRGNLSAIRQFVDQYAGRMRRAIERAGLCDAAAEDVLQDVFLRLVENDYHRLRQWRGESTLGSYLVAVARNAARDWLRAQHPTLPIQDGDEEPPVDPPDGRRSQAELVYLGRLRELVDRCLRMLNEHDRSLIGLRHFQERVYSDIAQILQITVNNVGVALLRAEQKLRRCLAGLAPELFWPNVWETGPA